uniref:Uncharacterized protein n=1 Tax=Panagrolaimus sp. PS1159 TaxID=55785 RepID=A0AC35GDW2_9BILA
MEKDKDEASKGKKGRVKPTDPRFASERYALMNETVRKVMEAQKIVENAVEASQVNDPNLMNISDDEESNNGNDIHQQIPQRRSLSTILACGETVVDTNELRKMHNESRRSNYPLLDTNASLYEIYLQPLQFSTPLMLVSNQSNFQNQPLSFQSSSDIPPPPSPLLPAQQCSPPAAINQHFNSQHSTDLHSPSKMASAKNLAELQQKNLNITKERNERLLAELKKSHEEEIQKLKDQLKAEQDFNADLKKQKEEVEKDAKRSSDEAIKKGAEIAEAKKEIKELKDKLKDSEKETAAKEGKSEAEAEIIEKYNRQQTALKFLFREYCTDSFKEA